MTPLLVLLAALAPPASAADTTTDARVHVLDNGLTVVLEPDDRTDTVALFVRYGVGSLDERDGEHGCAHLFEHLMFEGSANVPTNAFDTWLTSAGGWNNAYTSEDETAYYQVFPSGALDLALFLESDRLGFLDAGLDQANLDNQIEVVLQERRQGYAEPHGRDFDALNRLLYPAPHPYQVPVIGTVADVEGFELDAVVDFWQRHYRPRNAVLTLVGRFDPDHALQRVTHWFSDVVDTGEPPPRPTTPDTLDAPRDGRLEDRVEDRTLHLAWRTVPHGHADEPALDLLASILEGGRGTRLDDALYYRSDLATEVGVSTWNGALDGLFLASATSPTTPLARLERRMRRTLDRVAARPPRPEELDRAQRVVRGQLLDQTVSPVSRAMLLTDCLVTWGQPNCLAEQLAAYEAVTPEDISRVARTWLVPERHSRLLVVPEGDEAGADLPAVELP